MADSFEAFLDRAADQTETARRDHWREIATIREELIAAVERGEKVSFTALKGEPLLESLARSDMWNAEGAIQSAFIHDVPEAGIRDINPAFHAQLLREIVNKMFDPETGEQLLDANDPTSWDAVHALAKQRIMEGLMEHLPAPDAAPATLWVDRVEAQQSTARGVEL